MSQRETHNPTRTDWQPMLLGGRRLEGVSWKALTDTGPWHAYWMKMDPGSLSVPHRHAATELLQVLEGEVMDVDGQVFGAGDSLVYAAGSEHWLRSPLGCLLLVVESEPSALCD